MWTFSFPDRPLNVLVLLAEKDGYVHDYVLPPKIVQSYWNEFERDKKESGDVLFVRLKKTDAGPSLLLKSTNVPVTFFESNYSELQ